MDTESRYASFRICISNIDYYGHRLFPGFQPGVIRFQLWEPNGSPRRSTRGQILSSNLLIPDWDESKRNEYHDCVYRWHTGRLFLSTSAARVRGFESLHQSTLGFSIVVWTTGIPPGALLLKLRGITASHEICLRWTERTFSSHLSFHPLLRRGTCKLIWRFLHWWFLQSQNVRQCLLQCFMFIQRPQERQI